MIKNKIIPIYVAVCIISTALSFFGAQNIVDTTRAAPDDGIDGYQKLEYDWTVTGYEEYTDEIVELWGDLTIENGGHLVLNNCTLMMMYKYLQPYSIIVEDGGIMEVYDCNISDMPDDDDSEMLSAWYYFIARSNSTLIIENSTIWQVGFLDLTNPEHIGLSVGTNKGHITNTRINNSIVGLTFVGNNTGFYVDNINISEISMTSILMTYSMGATISNVTFYNIGEKRVISAEYSDDFTIKDIELSGEHLIRTVSSSGFTLQNITGNGSERLLEVEYCDDFVVKDIYNDGINSWNGLIELRMSSNFQIDQVAALNDNTIISIEDSSDGKITNVSGSNCERIIDFNRVSYVEISHLNADNGDEILQFRESDNLTVDDVYISNSQRSIRVDAVNDSTFSNLTITKFTEIAIDIMTESNNVTISDVKIDTDSMDFTTGIRADNSFVYLNDIDMFNLNRSIYGFRSDFYGEDIVINGTYEADEGMLIEGADYAYFSNVSIRNIKWRGIWIRESPDSDIWMENITINHSSFDGILIENSNATLSNINVSDSITDLAVRGVSSLSFVTVMNSTFDWVHIDKSSVIFINTTNTTPVNWGSLPRSLTWMWWVDVYVHDLLGPVAGAEVKIYNDIWPVPEVTSVTDLNGYARNIPVIDVIFTGGEIPMNPHRTWAGGPGWDEFNATPYFVTQNMQVNVEEPWNAPPNEPTNMIAQSDEDSNVVLTWDPSISQDVVNYTVYIAKSESDLNAYIGSGIPNATVPIPSNTFTHISGSEDWQRFWYGVKAVDNENESVEYAMASCGDWVVNATSPQSVEGMNISVEGSLLVYGQLELSNTSLRIHSNLRNSYGIYINYSSSFKCENVTIERNTTYPYFFIIQPGAEVTINDSEIKRPGLDYQDSEEPWRGIYSLSQNLRITNSTIEVITWGLGIYSVSNFIGEIYNITFTVPSSYKAEYLLNIFDSIGVKVLDCLFEGEAMYGIYGSYSQGINVTGTNISISDEWGETYYGIFMQECTDSQIFDNTLIHGYPGIYFTGSTNITIESSNISTRRDTAIYGYYSDKTTIRNCTFETLEGDQEGGIYLSWCTDSVIEDMNLSDFNPFLFLDNATGAKVKNLRIINGDKGIWLLNSNNIYVNDTYISFMFTGMIVTGCRDVYLVNTEINLTFYCIEIKSPGPINFINCTIANGIGNEIIAEGYEGQVGNVIIINSTIISISDSSLKLNNSAVVHLLNTSFNFTKLEIEDAASRVEVYHYLSIQVYNIDLNIPLWANITIYNFFDIIVYDAQATGGYADWILIHEITIFRDENYSNNPHRINYIDERCHFGTIELYINGSQHVDVYVSNELPLITWIDIYGFYDMPDPQPDITTYNPKTDFDIELDYTYEDPENDPESGTIIRWYVNGVYNSQFNGWTTIGYQFTSKFQTWQAVVYPSDGYDSTYPTYPYFSNVLFISNTPPVVSNITISPTDPTGGDNLYVEYDVFDLDGDGLDSSKTTHKWYHYNETLGDWEYSNLDSFYLPGSYTTKGQLWKCDITPHDGDDWGNNASSQFVTIGNTPPSVQDQKIVSEMGNITITSMDNLKADYSFIDLDGDVENGTTYEWYQSNDGFNWVKYDVNSSVLPNSYTQRGDLWRCRLIPSDGEDNGTEAWTDAVEIFNTPPMISNVVVTPQYAISADMLQVTYDYYDYDGDADNGTSFRWIYEDALGAKDSGIRGNETPSGVINKGQTWYCFVLPSDGRNVGTEVGSLGVLIHNTPPEIEDAQVVFETSDNDRWLTLIYTPEDIDGDDLGVINIEWFVDGNDVPQLDDNLTVPGRYLVKGEKWNATIRVFDGEDWSDWFTTIDVSIPNRAPYIYGTPILTPKKALSDQNLTPEFEDQYQDEDGDLLFDWDIKWYRNNGYLEDRNEDEISWELTGKEEIWYFKVRVSDGEDYSDWYSSTTSIIQNSPPSNVTLSPEEGEVMMTETETVEFEVSAKDMDEEDTLSYRWTLDGRIVLLEEGVSNSIYLMKTDYDTEGEYLLRLVISDGDDINETTWAIRVLKLNRLPEITVVEPEGRSAKIKEKQSLNFAITKSDPDGDNLDVYWYLDDTPTPVWEGSDKYTYTPADWSGGRSHNITVEVKEKDSDANSTYTWDIYVEDVEEAVGEKFLGLPWDVWSIIIEVFVIGGTGLLAFIGYTRIRKKKGALKIYMTQIEEISAEKEKDPDRYEQELNDIEEKIIDEFKEGRMEDLHYLMLQEFITSRKGEVRKAAITSKFERLPEGLGKELDEMLKDGKISRKEYEGFVATISKTTTLSEPEKEELSQMIEKWKVEDKDSAQEESMDEGIEPKEDEIGEGHKEFDEPDEDEGPVGEEPTSEENEEPEKKEIDDKSDELGEDKDTVEEEAPKKKKHKKLKK